MSDKLGRRDFLKKSLAGTAAGAFAMGFEERGLLARMSDEKPDSPTPAGSGGEMPTGRLGKLNVTRLIIGGNLTSGFAHSRDLIYVSGLLRQYFTDDKIFETWELCEECGINTAILRLDDHVVGLITKYWNERGGKLQWIVQVKPDKWDVESFKTDIQRCVDNGAVGAYVQGGVGDGLVKDNQMDTLAAVLQCIKDAGLVAGIGAHDLQVPIACEKAGLQPDFYMKTVHSPDYWSFNPHGEKWDKFHVSGQTAHDNVWCTQPRETVEFMKGVKTPWIAFKVLAAGAIPPQQGFKYAFENGADFICAGMFDFQVREDAIIARNVLNAGVTRRRPWRA
jgi:hypothetical protein